MGPRSLPDEDYFAVFDGHSGTEASILAARTLHSKLDKFLRLSQPISEALKNAFSETSQAMVQKNMRCGTCALVAFFSDRRIFIANVGDSRAVACRSNSGSYRITRDHRPDVAEELERIRSAGGNVTKTAGVYRLQGDISVSRALGDAHLKPFICDDPDVFELSLDDSLLFIILACDGLWDVLSDDDAVKIVQNAADPLKAASRLVEESLRRGSTDNVSVIVIELRPRALWFREEKRT